MVQTKRIQREYLLSLWARNRLAERETVSWALDALAKIRGAIGTDSSQLFKILDDEASKCDLSPPFKLLWKLFHKVARESVFNYDFGSIYEFQTKLNEGRIERDDIDRLIDLLRPRLRAKASHHWRIDQADAASDDPISWVGWEFETALHSSYQRDARPPRKALALLASDHLTRLLEGGTAALRDAMDDARQIGWLTESRDLPNLFVHRVFIQEVEKQAEDDDGYDPDDSNNDLVPIVRLLSEAFNALLHKDNAKAISTSNVWSVETSGLFLRLFAVSAWHADVQTGRRVGDFISGLKDEPFWLWQSYPEIATLRARRWVDIPVEVRKSIEARMLQGPPLEGSSGDTDDLDRQRYLRDHELARIVDAGLHVPNEFAQVVASRRAADPEFPSTVSSTEAGLPGTTVSWGASEGSADAFQDVPVTELLAKLTQPGTGRFGERDDTEAFTKTVEGKRRIIEALEFSSADEETTVSAWKILLSYSHVKDDDAPSDRSMVERIGSLAINLHPTILSHVARELCYWIDAADERVPRFAGSDELWCALLPHAEHWALRKEDENEGQSKNAVDLTSEALNEPLGHLISLFMRRCPTIPAHGERPPLPSDFVTRLKLLHGRARELLTNRMVIQTNYFARADMSWLHEYVLLPMMKEGQDSDRLWEAFAKYSRVPPPSIWEQLDGYMFRRLSSSTLSPEARRRLAEMNVMVWIWSKDNASHYRVDASKMRTAIVLANEDVRGAVSWQFSTLFRSKPENDATGNDAASLWSRFGRAFFSEIWPLEATLQSARSAKDFAKIPARVGPACFVDAWEAILPYLLPFEVWSVNSEFGLDPKEDATKTILSTFPSQVLTLLAACISERQQHGVFELGRILDQIQVADPELRRDGRMRDLRRSAIEGS